jgi:PTS system nitrogen regulatory IIA component
VELKIRDVAELLGVSEESVYGLIEDGELPAHIVCEQYRFNRVEVAEWAASRNIPVSSKLFRTGDPSARPASLVEAIRAGGVVYDLPGSDKTSVLRNAVGAMQLNDKVDRERLLQLLIARETMASTAIGDGLAIPHVRHPIVLHIEKPTITLCFLETPVDFGSLDGEPVYCLTMMVSPTVRAHLQMISRLAFVLKSPSVKTALERRAPKEEILAEIARIENRLSTPHLPSVKPE